MSEVNVGTQAASHAPFHRDLILGYGLLGLQPVFVRVLSIQHLTPMQTVWLRFVFVAVCIVAWGIIKRRWVSTAQPLWYSVRGVLGAVAVYLYFCSVDSVGAARATLLNYTYPFWANLFAVVLGARPPGRFWLGLLLAFVGVAVVVLPADGLRGFSLALGDVFGLSSAVVSGAAVLVVKQLRKTDDSVSIVGSFTVSGLLISSWSHHPLTTLQAAIQPAALWAALGVGLSSFWGHVYFTRGYRGATVQEATLLSLIVPLVAAVMGILVLGEPLGVRFILGAGLLLFALAFVARGPKTIVEAR
jgi:drug/metabolite transporter (DMT)-like permease